MTEKSISPEVTALKWGNVEVSGQKQFKDVKLFPGGAREWDWAETDTHHRPGVQPVDVLELLDHDVEAIVIARGVFKRLGITDDTEALLKERGVELHALETKEAVAIYNRLRTQKRVGALIHSTC